MGSDVQTVQERFDLITSDGLKLKATSSVPARPRGCVILAHGYAEHTGRYHHVIDALNERGLAVYAVDHRGHGNWTGRRASIRHFDTYVDDFHLLVEYARRQLDSRPLFVLGHSMGGLIAIRYALRHQSDLSGMVLTGPALMVGTDVAPWQTRLLIALSRLAPERALLPPTPGVLSRNPEVERAFAADPLCYSGRVRLGLARELYLAGKETCSHLRELRLPFLVMHGTDDRLTDPRGSERLYAESPATDKTLKLWPDDRHELFNELDANAVIRVMCEWFDARV
jgi:acylglycerol lipase